MKPNDFTITCNKCGSNDVKIVSHNVSYVIITEIICENEECKHTEQI
jgi:anaerobic ribonucleoside-triphosphate reductase